ncbi:MULTISPECIES: carbohydrate ABC transporter permease [Planktothrix]|jgi:putative chitobiose transport system permease protein|nr:MULTISPECIES: sugar ABC transporter permease [Planktothrix]MCF3606844.1 sugar ABC transporter permease [Planktothrix agardhii 1033]CAD5962936.1 Putative ABC transporter permease protein AmyD [Planktothrix rubescens]BBD56898.1 permease protein of sugar ABC transporter [Planktothrix agardhii NIES-204]MBG0746160.1 sugar ABC transporter permease [Planktothrix agardhii KL2]MCB8752996.1 sugar ABC transporter permease [Planktothrix agardhii 1810]
MLKFKPVFTPYLFLFPALLMLTLTVFWPALQAFYLSLFSYDLLTPPEWVGLKNFQRLWTDEVFWETLKNTFLYLIVVVPILVFVPLTLAILVNQKLRGMNGFRTAYYVPVVISMVVAGIAWKWLYAENGFFNQLLNAIAIPPIPWLTSPNIALFSVMAVTIWKGLGYYMVIYLAGLQGIPLELYEAASIDGSDGFKKHWDITLPLMKPYMVLVGVISAISSTKVFEEVFIMTQGGPRNSSKTIVYYLYERGFQQLEFGYACTIGLILFLIVLGLSILRLVIERFTENINSSNHLT